MATTFKREPVKLFSFGYLDEGDFFKLPYCEDVYVKLPETKRASGDWVNAYNFAEEIMVEFSESDEIVAFDAIIDLRGKGAN